MEPFVGQIMQVGFNFAPRSWAICNGQIMAISQNTVLFSLLGTTYGGDGRSTFGLPDTRGRVLIGTGTGPGLQPYDLGEVAGTENVTLTTAEMPIHTHNAVFTPSGGITGQVQAKSAIPQAQLSDTPTEGCFLANTADPEVSGTPLIYAPADSGGTPVNLGGVSVSGGAGGTVAVSTAGSSMPFSIIQPYLAITTIIALQGYFPSRN